MPNTSRIKSSTKGATIKKLGHTQSGKYGNSVSKKASHNTREIGPQGK